MKKLFVLILLLTVSGVVSAEEKSTVQVYCESGIEVFLDDFYKGDSKSKENGRILRNVKYGKHIIRLQKGLDKEVITFELSDTLLNIVSRTFRVDRTVELPKTNLLTPNENTANRHSMNDPDTLKIYVDYMTRMSKVSFVHFEPFKISDSASKRGGQLWIEGKINQQGVVKKARIGIPSNNDELNVAALLSAYSCTFHRGDKTKNKEIWIAWTIDVPYVKSDQVSESDSAESTIIDFSGKLEEEPVIDMYPEMIKHKKPEYPDVAKNSGIQGLVWVKALVDTNGDVKKAIVGRSCGVYLLDKSAIKAAYDNKFKPAMKDGVPVGCWVAYKVNFELR